MPCCPWRMERDRGNRVTSGEQRTGVLHAFCEFPGHICNNTLHRGKRCPKERVEAGFCSQERAWAIECAPTPVAPWITHDGGLYRC
eukprot:833109-Pelagomonas_calceolata.AAC.4